MSRAPLGRGVRFLMAFWNGGSHDAGKPQRAPCRVIFKGRATLSRLRPFAALLLLPILRPAAVSTAAPEPMGYLHEGSPVTELPIQLSRGKYRKTDLGYRADEASTITSLEVRFADLTGGDSLASKETGIQFFAALDAGNARPLVPAIPLAVALSPGQLLPLTLWIRPGDQIDEGPFTAQLRMGTSHGEESLPLSLSIHPGLTPDAGWPEWRYDERRMARSPLKGRIDQPVTKWEIPLGASSQPEVLNQTLGYSIPPVPAWVAAGATARVADLDPDNPGLEVAVFHGISRLGELFTYQGELLWSVTAPREMYTPILQFADVDQDGLLEIIVTSHGGVSVWDGATGHLDYDIPYQVGRQYGHSVAVNIDADPYLEIIVIADYVPHLDVIDIRNGSGDARVLWRHDFAPGWENSGLPRDILIRVKAGSVQDFNQDGVIDMAVNVYNAAGDRKWHLVFYDVETGDVLLDVADRFLFGARDLDGDGVAELMCADPKTVDPHTFSSLRVQRFTGAQLQSRWNTTSGRFLVERMDPRSLPDHVGTIAVDGLLQPLTGDINDDNHPEFLVERDLNGDQQADRIEGWRLTTAGAVEMTWVYDSPAAQPINARAFGNFTVHSGNELRIAELDTADLLTLDSLARVVNRSVGGAIGNWSSVPVAIDADGDGRMEIAIMNGRNQVELFKADGAGAPSRVWSLSGHGMVQYPGYTKANMMPAMADLDGDRRHEIIFAGASANGLATLAVHRADGGLIWEHVFDGAGFDGLYGSVERWFFGSFVGSPVRDVAVLFSRTGDNSSEIAVLDGEDGSLAWARRTIGEPPLRGIFSPNLLPVTGDFTAGGADEIAYAWGSIAYVIDGSDGSLLQAASLPQVFNYSGAYYSFATLLRNAGDPAPRLLWHIGNFMGLQEFDMTGVWSHVLTAGNTFPPGLADADGDGVFEIGDAGADGVFRCYRADDGEPLWSAAVGQIPQSYVGVADVNHDGVDDYFFTTTSGNLTVLRSQVAPGQNRLLWQHPIGGGQHPIFCDVDADGAGEFLVSTADGKLKCIDDVFDRPLIEQPPLQSAASMGSYE